jgi:hypothetical protein
VGNTIGEAYGVGGLGLVGTGYGGGGKGEGTIGFGNLGTIGKGGGGSSSGTRFGYGAGPGYGYGYSGGSLGGRRARAPDVIPGAALVRGSLDKEIIRRIIRAHQNEIKYCYEQQLQKDHKLEGRLVLRLVIDNGKVVGSSIVDSQMENDAEIGACVAQAGRRFMFPAALGGGITIVSYPYVFRRADSAMEDKTEEKKQ